MQSADCELSTLHPFHSTHLPPHCNWWSTSAKVIGISHMTVILHYFPLSLGLPKVSKCKPRNHGMAQSDPVVHGKLPDLKTQSRSHEIVILVEIQGRVLHGIPRNCTLLNLCMQRVIKDSSIGFRGFPLTVDIGIVRNLLQSWWWYSCYVQLDHIEFVSVIRC